VGLAPGRHLAVVFGAVTFGGSATPSLTGLSTSDAISLQLDTTHDYWVMGYNDSGDSSYWVLKPAMADNTGTIGIIGGYVTGDHTADTTIGSGGSFSPGYGCPWDAVLAA